MECIQQSVRIRAGQLGFSRRRLVFAVAVLLGELFGIKNPTWITFTSPTLLEFIFGSIAALAFLRFRQQRKLGVAMLMVGATISLYRGLINNRAPPLGLTWCCRLLVR
jgi:hypothetical protein